MGTQSVNFVAFSLGSYSEPTKREFGVGATNLVTFRHRFRVTRASGISFAKDDRLAAALDYMTRHLVEELHIDHVAKEVGISPCTLNRLLHEEHISFSAYLNYQRIIRAVELIADGKRILAEVAYATGFSAPSNFNRTFRQILGMSRRNTPSRRVGVIELL